MDTRRDHCDLLIDPELAPRSLPAMAPSDPTVPYSEKEQAALLEWAQKRKQTKRCDDAMMLLALGFGAGLSPSFTAVAAIHS